MRRPHWVDLRALVLLHGESLAEHGGLSGLRDFAALEAAMARPQHVFSYEADADVARLAAAYGFGLIRGHPFVDGNKRVGFLAVGLFLQLNGFQLEVEEFEAVEMVMSLAAGNLTEKKFAKWIREHILRTKT